MSEIISQDSVAENAANPGEDGRDPFVFYKIAYESIADKVS